MRQARAGDWGAAAPPGASRLAPQTPQALTHAPPRAAASAVIIRRLGRVKRVRARSSRVAAGRVLTLFPAPLPRTWSAAGSPPPGLRPGRSCPHWEGTPSGASRELSLLSAGSRALPSALPAKPEFLRLLVGSRRTSEALFIWLSEKKGEGTKKGSWGLMGSGGKG